MSRIRILNGIYFANKHGMRNLIILLLIVAASIPVIAQEAAEGLFINSKAPDFKFTNNEGKTIRLKDAVKDSMYVLVFYRGEWCPYCNKFLKKLQDSLNLVSEKKAAIIAITPETKEFISKTREKTNASFYIVQDVANKIMQDYKVLYAVPEATVERYKTSGIDIAAHNGSQEAYLPIPAVYLVDKDMRITYRFFSPDYKKRPSVKEILNNINYK